MTKLATSCIRLKSFKYKLSSGSMIFLTIIRELRVILQDICKTFVTGVLINISFSNIYTTALSHVRFYKNYQAELVQYTCYTYGLNNYCFNPALRDHALVSSKKFQL